MEKRLILRVCKFFFCSWEQVFRIFFIGVGYVVMGDVGFFVTVLKD